MAIVLNPPTGKLLLPGPLKIDWSNPLATGLIGCWVPGVFFGINLAGNGTNLKTDTTLATTATTGNTQEGPGLLSNTGANSGLNGVCTSPFLDYSNGKTHFWRGLPIAAATNTSNTIGVAVDITGGTSNVLSSITLDGARNPLLKWNNAGTANNGGAGGLTVTLGQMYTLAGTFAVGGNAILYVYGPGAANGVQNTTAFGASAPTGAGANTGICLNTSENVFQNIKANCNIACIWNRVLSAQEISALNDDPYQFLIPAEGLMPALGGAAPAVPTGTLATTEAQDVAAFTGTAGVAGTLATTEAQDVAAFNATYAVTGTLATTEAQDVAAFNATFAITGTLATTEAQDIAAFNATFAITGTLNTTEAQDTAAFNATFAITGTLATTEGQDTASFTGSGVTVSGPLAVTEAPDTAAFTGNFVVSGTLATTEAKDTAAFTGSFIVVTGTLATTEAQDTAAFTGTISGAPVGVLAATEAPDIVSISGVIVQGPSSGYLAATEAQDIVYIVGPGLVPLDPVGVLNFGRRVVINRW